MRIAIVTDYHNKTGIGKQNYQLYRALNDLGHETEIINLVSKQGFKETPKYGTNLIAGSFLKGVFWTFRRALRRHLAAKRYDAVLLGHQGLAYLRGVVKVSGTPCVLTVFDLFALYPEYSPSLDPRYFVFRNFFLRQVRNFENIAFSSHFTERDFERLYGKKPQKFVVIPIGIPKESRTSDA